MPDLPALDLLCFGAPTALVGGAPAPPRVLWRKHLGLLIYLALSPQRRRSREHLTGWFWSESPQEKARQSLNNAVLRLRQGLGEERIISEGAAVILNDRDLTVDAVRFQALAERAPADAVQLLRGRFLEGFHVDQAEEFERWMSAQRQRFDEHAADAWVRAGRQAVNERRLTAAADHAREALELAPHSEPAIIVLMEALYYADDSAGALAAYQAFAARLEREVGERPSKAVSDCAARIRSRTPPSATPGSAPRVPLVGRKLLHGEVFEAVETGLRGSPRTVVITAAPGMGRSRLLAECLRIAERHGACLGVARPLESDRDTHWSTLRSLFRASLAEGPGLPAASGDALAMLATVIPSLAQRATLREPRDHAELAGALRAVLAAIADETPVLLAIDDAHWTDAPTLTALRAAMTGLDQSRVAFVLTVGTGMTAPRLELQQLLADVEHDLPGLTAHLDPLRLDAVQVLVARLAPWCTDPDKADRLARRLHYETGGTPLYLVTLLGALERESRLRADLTQWPMRGRTEDDPLPIGVPAVVGSAIQLRIGELSPEEKRVLVAASVGGHALDLALLAELAECPGATVEQALPALERRYLVSFDGGGYRIMPIVAEFVRSQMMTPGERHRLEGRAATRRA